MDLQAGSYYGARKPEDGRIDWTQDAQQIHNLVRAVAPPYPGATTKLGGHPARVLRTRIMTATGPACSPTLTMRDGKFLAHCGGGGVLHIVDLEMDGRLVTADAMVRVLGSGELPLGETASASAPIPQA
jgi:methionyl-tRNA formyltransferase